MFSKVTIILNSVCGYMLEKGEVKGERDEKKQDWFYTISRLL